MDVNGLLTRILSRTHIFHGKVPWILVKMFNQSIEIAVIHNPVVFTLFSLEIFWEASGQLERRVGHGQGIFFRGPVLLPFFDPNFSPKYWFCNTSWKRWTGLIFLIFPNQCWRLQSRPIYSIKTCPDMTLDVCLLMICLNVLSKPRDCTQIVGP